jgi:hypothetical protein
VYARGYHRTSDDSVTRVPSTRSFREAVADVRATIGTDSDVDIAWVYDRNNNRIIFRAMVTDGCVVSQSF